MQWKCNKFNKKKIWWKIDKLKNLSTLEHKRKKCDIIVLHRLVKGSRMLHIDFLVVLDEKTAG